MPKTLVKSRLRTNKHKPKTTQEVSKTKKNYLNIFSHLNKIYYQDLIF